MNGLQPMSLTRSSSEGSEVNFAQQLTAVPEPEGLSAATIAVNHSGLLEMLQEELHRIPIAEKQEYLEALQQNLVDPSMFLRRKAYDVKVKPLAEW